MKEYSCCKYLYQFEKMLIKGGQFEKTCDDLQKLIEQHKIRM